MQHILLAEYEKNLRLSISMILRSAGYEVTVSANGQEALDSMSNNDYDLLITDIEMPKLNGLELIHALRSKSYDIPIIVMTGYGNKDLVVELLHMGVKKYLDKPMEMKNILKTVHGVLSERAEKQDRQEKKKLMYNRELERYQENLANLEKQIDSSVVAYNELVFLNKKDYQVKIEWKNRPLANLGGDFIGIKDTADGCEMLIADVAGHDMGASIHAVSIKAFFEENTCQSSSGEELLQLLNKQLLDGGKNQRMVTALFLSINLKENECTMVSAGHPFPVIQKSMQSALDTFSAPSQALGIFEVVELATKKIDISSEDRLFLYTDGLLNRWHYDVETGEKQKLRMKDIEEIISKYHQKPLSTLVNSIWEGELGIQNYKQTDDMMLVGVEIPL